MRKINWKNLKVEEIGAVICEHLSRHSFNATLTGGACVTIYSSNQYQSGDLDFVMPFYDLKEVDEAMSEIGFKRIRAHRHYINPECPFYVEFPPPPLSIGEEIISKVHQFKGKYGILKLLTPTDCVKDRLAAYYHWNDQQSLEQALMVAAHQTIDVKNIREWSKGEMSLDKFSEFEKRLGKKKSK